jgi:hypothetical protein
MEHLRGGRNFTGPAGGLVEEDYFARFFWLLFVS